MGCSRGDRVANTRCLQPHTLSAGHLPELGPPGGSRLAPEARGQKPRGPAVLGLVTVQGFWGGVFLSRFCSSHLTKQA